MERYRLNFQTFNQKCNLLFYLGGSAYVIENQSKQCDLDLLFACKKRQMNYDNILNFCTDISNQWFVLHSTEPAMLELKQSMKLKVKYCGMINILLTIYVFIKQIQSSLLNGIRMAFYMYITFKQDGVSTATPSSFLDVVMSCCDVVS